MSSDADTKTASTLRTVRPRWTDAIFVCGKCLKGHSDGKSMRQALKAEVRAQTKGGPKNRKVRIVKTACLGLCPKGAVILANAATLSAGDVLLVKDVGEIADAATRLIERRFEPDGTGQSRKVP